MKMSNMIGPTIDSWGAPLVTNLQLGFVVPITTLQTGSSARYQSTSPYTTLAHTSSVCPWGCYGKQYQKPPWSQDKQYVLFFPLPPTSHFVVGSYQVGQACLSLCKSVLTTPDHLFLLTIVGNYFWVNLLSLLSQRLGWSLLAYTSSGPPLFLEDRIEKRNLGFGDENEPLPPNVKQIWS